MAPFLMAPSVQFSLPFPPKLGQGHLTSGSAYLILIIKFGGFSNPAVATRTLHLTHDIPTGLPHT